MYNAETLFKNKIENRPGYWIVLFFIRVVRSELFSKMPPTPLFIALRSIDMNNLKIGITSFFY